MAQRVGRRTIRLETPVSVLGYAAIGSKKEGEGPLGAQFDKIEPDTAFGQSSWEKAESQMQTGAVRLALDKSGLALPDCDCLFAGDLLNQCIGSSYSARGMDVPFVGLYGACSTMAEALGTCALFLESGAIRTGAAVTSSHFCSAERQFRFPLEYGGQRTPTSQWTATASGAVVLGKGDRTPFVRQLSFGTVQDLGVRDANNMGAAMAPAAAKTIRDFFTDTCTNQENYDAIFTGDLGQVGSALLLDLLMDQAIYLGQKHHDCGMMLYDLQTQDVHAGASGCGCSAAVLCAEILPKLRSGQWQDVLFVATGALMSTTAVQQGESIPGVAHLIHFSARQGR